MLRDADQSVCPATGTKEGPKMPTAISDPRAMCTAMLDPDASREASGKDVRPLRSGMLASSDPLLPSAAA